MNNQLPDSAPVTDEDLDHMILGLERDGIYPKLLSLMRELRERRKAKRGPVALVLSCRAGNDTSTIDKALPEGTALYTAPPAQVVPDEMAISDDMNLYQKSFAQGHNACRAAMLQESQKTAGVPQNCRSCAKVQVLPTGMQTAPALDFSPKNAGSPSGMNTAQVNDVTSGKRLTITLPDVSSKAFWSGTDRHEVFHPETYKRWVKEAIERDCIIAGVGVKVK